MCARHVFAQCIAKVGVRRVLRFLYYKACLWTKGRGCTWPSWWHPRAQWQRIEADEGLLCAQDIHARHLSSCASTGNAKPRVMQEADEIWQAGGPNYEVRLAPRKLTIRHGNCDALAALEWLSRTSLFIEWPPRHTPTDDDYAKTHGAARKLLIGLGVRKIVWTGRQFDGVQGYICCFQRARH